MNTPNLSLALRVLEEELRDSTPTGRLGIAEASGLLFAELSRLAATPDDTEQALDRLVSIAAVAMRAVATLSEEELS